jgi:hypothetical protein
MQPEGFDIAVTRIAEILASAITGSSNVCRYQLFGSSSTASHSPVFLHLELSLINPVLTDITKSVNININNVPEMTIKTSST